MIDIQPYTYTCRNKINNNDEQTRIFRKIYLSHFIWNGCERVMCERWVGDWTNCNILTPCSSVFSSTSFSFCWAAQLGALRAQPSAESGSHCNKLTPTVSKLTEPVCGPGLYNCLMPTCFLCVTSAPNSTRPQSRLYPDIFDRMHLFIDWRLGRRSICYNHTQKYGRESHGAVANMLDCNIIVSSNFSCTIMFTFRLIPLRKKRIPLSI